MALLFAHRTLMVTARPHTSWVTFTLLSCLIALSASGLVFVLQRHSATQRENALHAELARVSGELMQVRSDLGYSDVLSPDAPDTDPVREHFLNVVRDYEASKQTGSLTNPHATSSAASSTPAPLPDMTAYTPKPACESANGRWGATQHNAFSCFPVAPDFGATCSDSAECSYRCEAPHGTPTGTTAVGSCVSPIGVGCSQELVHGVAQQEQCL